MSYLIPALNRRSDRVQDDSKIQSPGMFPAVCDFLSEQLSIGLVKLDDVFDPCWGLRHQRTLSQEVPNLAKVMFVCERVNILEELVFGDAGQRILDPRHISNENKAESVLRTLR